MGQETRPAAASRFAHTPDILYCLADVVPNNKSLLFNLCLVSRTFYSVFKPSLWRDMCQGDFYAKQDSLNSSTESENLIYMRTYDDHMDGIRTTREFHRYMVFSHTPNLELAAFEPAYQELLETIQRYCPKIQGLHLEMCEHRAEIDPVVFSGFSNLTHLVIDGMTIENYGWTWHEQAESLADLLIRSPQMRKLGLCAIGHHERIHYFFVLVSEIFAKNSGGITKLRLNTLLLDHYQYPPPSNSGDDPTRYISQLTDVRYLEHLHLGAVGQLRPIYDATRFSPAFGSIPVIPKLALQTVLLPSFIALKTAPKLRLLSVDSVPEIPPKELERLNFSQSDFANQLSVHSRVTNDFYSPQHTDQGLAPSFSRWAKAGNEYWDDKDKKADSEYWDGVKRRWPNAERKWNLRSTVLEQAWSHDAEKNKTYIFLAEINWRDRLGRMIRTGQDTLNDLTIYLMNLDRHEVSSSDLTVPITDDMRLCDRQAGGFEVSERLRLPDTHWRGRAGCLSARSALEMVEPVIMAIFGGLGARFLERLYIPMSIRTGLAGSMTKEEADEWTRGMIEKLAAEDCLPGLRYAKLHGPAYEIDRRPGGGFRLLRLSWAEEREIELFRDDVWAPWWS